MIHLYGLIIGFAVSLGFYYFQHNTILPKKYHDSFFLGLFISCLLGARLYHLIDYWSYYQNHLGQIFTIWEGGLGIFGALFAGILFLFIFCIQHNFSFVQLLNNLVTPVSLIQAIGRWGNFTNHEVYGSKGEPVWFYESIACFLLFLFLHFHPKNRLAYYLFFYGLVRFFLEFFRNDTWQINGLKVAQAISLVFITIGLHLLLFAKSKYSNHRP